MSTFLASPLGGEQGGVGGVSDAFAFQANHGIAYKGETWKAEHDALTQALTSITLDEEPLE
jgi:hypothetical protein